MDAKHRILDKSKVVIPSGTIEDFKRPNHPDFMDSSELKKAQWSGVRHNTIAAQTEIWVNGEILASVSDLLAAANPNAIEEAYIQVFGLPTNGVEFRK